MELKKILRKFSLLVMILSIVFNFSTAVSAESDILTLGRISAVMPDVTVELYGRDHDASNLGVTLAEEELSLVAANAYDKDSVSTCAYVLVDLSTSMYGSFNLVKENLITYIEDLGENDKLILITFGESEVNTVLNGAESREDAINTVGELECNEDGTLLYEALNKAYQLSSSSVADYDREYVLLFTDGTDWQKGSTTFNEALDQYKYHSLPIYAACSYDASQNAADKLGELSRSSGGAISIVEDEETFDALLAQINDITILKCRALTNCIDGAEKLLSVKEGPSQIHFNLPITRSTPDLEAPTVREISYEADKGEIRICFSEKVLGAQDVSSYKIIDPNGNQVKVSSVFLNEDGTYEIKLEDKMFSGEYTVSFSGITDASQERNPLKGQQSLTVEVEDNEASESTEPVTNDKGSLSTGIIIAIAAGCILLIALIILILFLTHKNQEISEDEQPLDLPRENDSINVFEHVSPPGEIVKHHIVNTNTVRIRLKIKTGSISEQNIETNIASSLIVGRSDTCDIYIDDTKLSRQHFVIENEDGRLYVMDLQSRNGTMLNGIRIQNRQLLHSGDKILAGLSDIVITIIKG